MLLAMEGDNYVFSLKNNEICLALQRKIAPGEPA